MSRSNIKTNNAKDNRKILLRKNHINNIIESNVLELFCGDGVIKKKVYNEVKKYTGVDIKDNGKNIVSDAVDFVKSNDISNYDIIDIDPYGDPYTVLINIKKIKKDVTFFITDGLYTDLSMGNICKSIQLFTGMNQNRILKANRIHLILIKIIINKFAKKHSAVLSNFYIFTGKTQSHVKYYTFKLTKLN